MPEAMAKAQTITSDRFLVFTSLDDMVNSHSRYMAASNAARFRLEQRGNIIAPDTHHVPRIGDVWQATNLNNNTAHQPIPRPTTTILNHVLDEVFADLNVDDADQQCNFVLFHALIMQANKPTLFALSS